METFGVETIDADDWLTGNQYICNNLSYVLSLSRLQSVALLGGLLPSASLSPATGFGFLHLPTFDGPYPDEVLEVLAEEIKYLSLSMLLN